MPDVGSICLVSYDMSLTFDANSRLARPSATEVRICTKSVELRCLTVHALAFTEKSAENQYIREHVRFSHS